MEQLKPLMTIKWAERLEASDENPSWVRFLGKEWHRDAVNFSVITPPCYLQQIFALMRLEKAKSAPTPFLSTHQVDETLLESLDHRLFRTVVGKLMWVMDERGDIAFATKELARKVQAPRAIDMQRLRRLVKYLLGTQHYVQVLRLDASVPNNTIRVHVDANWASLDDMRSTSGGVLRLDGFQLHHWARTQPIVTQSSCETELLAMNTGAAEGRLVQSILKEMGMPVSLQLLTDSSSAKAVTLRRGPGRMMHIAIRQLWLQEEVRQQRLSIEKVSTVENGADLFTKAVPRVRLLELCSFLGLQDRSSDSGTNA